MRFRIDTKGGFCHPRQPDCWGLYHIFVDGKLRGLIALQEKDGTWGAALNDTKIIGGRWGRAQLIDWLKTNLDPSLLPPPIPDPQLELEV